MYEVTSSSTPQAMPSVPGARGGAVGCGLGGGVREAPYAADRDVAEPVVLDAFHGTVHPQYYLGPRALAGGRGSVRRLVQIEVSELVADDLDLAVFRVWNADRRRRRTGIVVVRAELARWGCRSSRSSEPEEQDRQRDKDHRPYAHVAET